MAAPFSQPLRRPAARHYLTRVTQRTLAKEINTLIEPGIDIASDVTAINAGQATRQGDTFVINGRTYGVHSGTLYPITGPGFHQLHRGAFKVLGVYNAFGDTPHAVQILDNMGIGSAEREAAFGVWSAGQRR